jgi:hypothetical protein
MMSAAFIAAFLLRPAPAEACQACFGIGLDTPTTRGIGLAMLLLVGMTGVVWGGIGAFFYNLRKRARLLEPGNMVVNENGEIQIESNKD